MIILEVKKVSTDGRFLFLILIRANRENGGARGESSAGDKEREV